jgi:hypothetical protein
MVQATARDYRRPLLPRRESLKVKTEHDLMQMMLKQRSVTQ